MGIQVCPDCQTVEGGRHELTAEELKKHGFAPEDEVEGEIMACNECGSTEEPKRYAEHDEYDLER